MFRKYIHIQEQYKSLFDMGHIVPAIIVTKRAIAGCINIPRTELNIVNELSKGNINIQHKSKRFQNNFPDTMYDYYYSSIDRMRSGCAKARYDGQHFAYTECVPAGKLPLKIYADLEFILRADQRQVEHLF